ALGQACNGVARQVSSAIWRSSTTYPGGRRALPLPGRIRGLSPCAPSRGKIRELGERAVALDHRAKEDDGGLLDRARALAGKELPGTVLFVVGHQKDRLPPEGNRLGGEDREIGRIVEGPGHSGSLRCLGRECNAGE